MGMWIFVTQPCMHRDTTQEGLELPALSFQVLKTLHVSTDCPLEPKQATKSKMVDFQWIKVHKFPAVSVSTLLLAMF